MAEQENQSKYEFKAEIKKLLDILSKSLYKHREIFLRELVSNSVDALRRMRFLSLVEDDVTSPDAELQIEIVYDKDTKTLTIKDTGVGMSKDELITNLGTIAGSGSQKFLEQFKDQKPQEKEEELDLDIIGQFGVGFYSVFMVAETARVVSKSYKKDELAFQWESSGTGEFTITPADKEERGTDVVLQLHNDASEFLEQYRLETIVKKYSNFVPFPIFVISAEDYAKLKEAPPAEEKKEEKAEEKAEGEVDTESEEEDEEVPKTPEPVNETRPLWKRNASEITDEDYKNFYHYIARRYDNYLHVINYKIDGRVQFRSILFIPESKSADLLQAEPEYGLALYSKNVMVMERSEDMIPRWMRFIQGVVESDDIPLNVSRETIQADRVITKMSNLIVKRALREIQDMAEKEQEKYRTFWKEQGFFVKEGVVTDQRRKDKLVPLLRFKTSKTGDDELIGFDDYVKRMKPDQDKIYYLVGEDLDTMKQSPHMGFYTQEDLEVILFDEPIDNFLMMHLREYVTEVEPTEEGKEKEEKHYPLVPIDVSEEEQKKLEEEAEKEEGEKKEEDKEEKKLPPEQQAFVEFVKTHLGDKVMDVKMSERLYGSPCRLANPAGGMTSSMQRAMRYWTQSSMGKEFQVPRKILELNPDNPIVKTLIEIHGKDPESEKVKLVTTQLFENSLLAEGDLPNPAAMVPRLNRLIEILMTGKNSD